MRKIKIEKASLTVAPEYFAIAPVLKRHDRTGSFLVVIRGLEEEIKTSLAPVRAKYEEVKTSLDPFLEAKVINTDGGYMVNHNETITFSGRDKETIKKKYLDFLIRKTLLEWNFDLLKALEYVQKRYMEVWQ